MPEFDETHRGGKALHYEGYVEMEGKGNRKHAREGYISFCFCVSYFANMHALISMNKS